MFQIEEIEHAKLEAKDETLEEDLKAMEHSEEIIKKLGGLAYQLDESEDAVIHSLNKMAQEIQHLTNYQKRIDEIYQRLHASIVDLEDIAGEMKQISERTNYDQQSIQEMRERVDLINQLCFKHQVNSVVSLMAFYNDLQKKAKDFENIETEIDKLEDTLKLQEQKLTDHSNQLTSKRKQVIPNFEKNVESLLKDLKMQHAAFKIQMVTIDQFGPMGKDQISFLFAPNKGSQFHPIKEVASGGELSRLALITKSLVAASLKLPTLIFDEIDSGISGEVALKMGHIIKSMSNRHQIISITHSPQVAAKAKSHFHVTKRVKDEKTKASVKPLDQEERIFEIAVMLSSSPPSIQALANAAELINL